MGKIDPPGISKFYLRIRVIYLRIMIAKYDIMAKSLWFFLLHDSEKIRNIQVKKFEILKS